MFGCFGIRLKCFWFDVFWMVPSPHMPSLNIQKAFGMVCNGLGCWEPAVAPKWKEMVVRNSEKQVAVCLILIRAYIIRFRCTSHQATMRVNNPNCRLV